jgi:uncharacterized protein
MSTDQMNEVVELTAQDSWALLRKAVVGRLALIVNGDPDVFPVNHKVDHGSVLFRSAEGTKFTAALGHTVAFEVDGYDVQASSAWSVVVKGTATEVTRLYEVLDAFELPLVPWHSAPKPHFIRIEPDTITGRRFEVTGKARSAALADRVHHAADE